MWSKAQSSFWLWAPTMVKVKLYASFRELAGVSAIDLEASTVQELLEALCRRSGDRFRAALFESTGLRRHVAIMVDGVSIGRLKGLETALSPSSAVSILPPVTGGGIA